MYLCDDGHDEVCYSGRNCPACEHFRDKDKEIMELETKVDRLEEEIDDLKDQLKEVIQ